MNAEGLMVAVLMCTCVSAQTTRAPGEFFVPLSGVVHNTTREPLQGVHIELKNLKDRKKFGVYSNSAGLFRCNLVEGVYRVTAKSRTQKISKEIRVAGGMNWISLTLQEKLRKIRPTAVSVVRVNVPAEARSAFEKARDDLENNDPAAAAQDVDRAIEFYPHYVEALTIRSILERDRDPERALADAEKAIAHDPDYGEARVALASVYTSLGKFDDAVRTLDRGIPLAPGFWMGYYEMTRAVLCKQDYAVALGYLEISSDLAPKSYPFLHIARADAFAGLHDNSAAIRELEAYLTEAPQGDQVSQAKIRLAILKSQ